MRTPGNDDAVERASTARRIGIAFAVSLLAHGLFQWLSPTDLPHFADGVVRKEVSTLEFEIEEVTPRVATHSVSPALVGATTSHIAAVRGSDGRAELGLGTTLIATEEPQVVGDAQPEQAPAVCVPAHGVDLAPRAVALSSEGVPGVPTLTDRVNANIGRYFVETAHANPQYSHRPAPELHAMRDGSYTYSNSRFHVRIDPDGDVSFQDIHFGASGPGEWADAAGLPPGSQPVALVTIRFDITEEWMRANGQDPLRTERAWFMTETEELRERLHASAVRRFDSNSMRRLSARLAAIASDAHMSTSAKHAAVLEIWDDCATDSIGERARAQIVEFVQQHFPAGSALAYSESELRAYNQRRAGAPAFDPYAHADVDAGAG